MTSRRRVIGEFLGIGVIALLASWPASTLPGFGPVVACIGALIALLSFSRAETQHEWMDALLASSAYTFLAWAPLAFIARLVTLRRKAEFSMADMELLGVSRTVSQPMLEASIAIGAMFSAFLWLIPGLFAAVACTILRKKLIPESTGVLQAVRRFDGKPGNWLDLHVEAPLEEGTILTAVRDLGFEITVARSGHFLLRSAKSWTLDRSLLRLEERGRTFRARLQVSWWRALGPIVAAILSAAVISVSAVGVMATLGFAFTKVRLLPLWIGGLFPFGAASMVVLFMHGTRTQRLLQRLPDAIAGLNAHWQLPTSQYRMPAIDVLGASVMFLASAPLWLLVVPLKLGIACVVLHLAGYIVILTASFAAAAERQQIFSLHVWSRHSADTGILFALGLISTVSALVHAILRYMAAHGPGRLTLAESWSGPLIFGSMRRAWLHGPNVADLPNLMAAIQQNAEPAAKLADLRGLLSDFHWLVLLFGMLSLVATRLPLLMRGNLDVAPIYISMESQRPWRVAAHAMYTLVSSIAYQLFAVLLAVYAIATLNRVMTIGSYPLDWIVYPIALFRSVSPSTATVFALVFAAPAAAILIELMLAIARDVSDARRVRQGQSDPKIAALHTLWRERFGPRAIPMMAYEDGSARPIRTPEVRFLLVSPFRYIALPTWFHLGVFDAATAAALLAHEHYHFEVERWKSWMLRTLFLLAFRSTTAIAAFSNPYDEFNADRHARELLGRDGREPMRRAIRLTKFFPLMKRSTVPRQRPLSEYLLPRQSTFLRIWPSSSERLARLANT